MLSPRTGHCRVQQRWGRRPSAQGPASWRTPLPGGGGVLTAHSEVAAKTPHMKSPCPGTCTSAWQ